MPDFTSSLYLGFRHASHTLEPWESLTTGTPAVLTEPERSRPIAQGLAALQGVARGVLAPSTLHLFWDLFGWLAREPTAIFYDEGIYPIARWGIERAVAHGGTRHQFSHHDDGALKELLERHYRRGICPLIVTDGFCLACGKTAPVREYLACAREFGGMLIIDDTQSLGILGNSPNSALPYGFGGGGTLPWSGASGPEIVVVSSLAKGFGAPLAALCGSNEFVERFAAHSVTRVHCSPPSMAAVHAAAAALEQNAFIGDTVRQRLARLVSTFRTLLIECGLSSVGGLFPVQTLRPDRRFDAVALHSKLLHNGIRTVLHNRDGVKTPLISFIVTARHTLPQLEATAAVLQRVMASASLPQAASQTANNREWTPQ